MSASKTPASGFVGSTTDRDRARTSLIVIAVLAHLLIATALAATLNIWVDEAFTLNTTGYGVGYAIHQALNYEIQAPLYFILVTCWRIAGSSVLFIRTISIISVAGAIWLMAASTRYLFKRVNPAFIAFWLAFHPFTLWAATEIRLYGFAFLLSAALVYFFIRGFCQKSGASVFQWMYALVAIAALYTQYYLGFILVANALTLIVFRDWRSLARYCLLMSIVGLCFSPMLPVVVNQSRLAPLAQSLPLTPRQAPDAILLHIKQFLLPVATNDSDILRRWLIRAAYLVGAVIVVVCGKRCLSRINVATLVFLLTLCLFFGAALCIVPDGLLLERHTVPLFVGVILFVACVADNLNTPGKIVFALMLVAFSGWTSFTNFRYLAKDGDWQRVTKYIEATESPNQPIFVFHSGAALPIKWYYRGSNKVIALPEANKFDRFDLQDFVIKSEEELNQKFKEVDANVAWLVNDEKCNYAGVDYNCSLLNDFVQRNFVVLSRRDFYGSRVVLLKRKS